MRVRYIYSACVAIETANAAVLCDPWFSDGIYDGSWYHYPPLPKDPLDIVGRADAIWISHIHPDHFDPDFLRRYFDRYPDTRLLVCDGNTKDLQDLMRVHGFAPEAAGCFSVGDIELHTYANTVQNPGFDTALVAVSGEESVVNVNDNPFDPAQLDRLLGHCPGGRPTLALLPYAGAGPYPQTFQFDNEEDQRAEAAKKREKFIDQFRRYRDYLNARHCLPFAGKYYLGGPLARLNELRGVPDPLEVAQMFSDGVIVLEDGGQAYFDLATETAHGVRTERYDRARIADYLGKLDFPGYDYEREVAPKEGRRLPIRPLLKSALEHAQSRFEVADDFWFCITTDGGERFYTFNVADGAEVRILGAGDVEKITPRHEIRVDERYLFGLLTRLYHWNNAEIGSLYLSRRVPDVFRREVYSFLYFLHV